MGKGTGTRQTRVRTLAEGGECTRPYERVIQKRVVPRGVAQELGAAEGDGGAREGSKVGRREGQHACNAAPRELTSGHGVRPWVRSGACVGTMVCARGGVLVCEWAHDLCVGGCLSRPKMQAKEQPDSTPAPSYMCAGALTWDARREHRNVGCPLRPAAARRLR